jgi:hypothetical protein
MKTTLLSLTICLVSIFGFAQDSTFVVNQDTLFEDQNRYVYFKVGNKYGYMDKKRTVLIPCIYDDLLFCNYYSEGLFTMILDGKTGVVDTLNNIILPFIYDEALCYLGDYCLMKHEDKWNCFDKSGNEIFPIKYVSSEDEYIKVYSRRENGSMSFGLINTLGEEVIPCKFDEIYTLYPNNIFFPDKRYKREFRDKCKVTLNGRTFYIDKNGNEIKE